ncbi:NAD(P)-dependent oxidoreductase [Kineococcus arenarius]|uniref:NAD(P)-dependent oxidoreductase n=1 Tax=Kineococcus sp. SYSU DK007 TaxID=3383128 RepID=UPI003D7C513F
MSAPLVLITGAVTPDERAQLIGATPGLQLAFTERAGTDPDLLAVAEGLVGSPDAGELARAPRVRWVHSWAAGVDGIAAGGVLSEPIASGRVLLTAAKGSGAVPLAEHVLLLLLMLTRDVPRWLRAQEARHWDRYQHGELFGSRLGVIGSGRAGSELTARAAAFGMEVVQLRRGYDRAELETLLTTSDAIAITAPATRQTIGMLGDAEFALCARNPYYVCVSRGGIADDGALLRALRSGQLAGAGLDAHSTEPLPEDSPFWGEPHVIVTPHNAATTRATRQRGLDMLAHNLAVFASDGITGRFDGVVDPSAGY